MHWFLLVCSCDRAKW